MFEKEQVTLEKEITRILEDQGIASADLKWTWIPFSGQWGLSTSFFATAAKNLETNPELSVGERAVVIAEIVKEQIQLPAQFYKIESVKGYINLFFDPIVYAERVVREILERSKNFGKGDPTGQTIMVEFSQPNTHKAFHVGHLRNMVLGSSISKILEYAGNQVIRTNYIGDIGLHVIKWLWNYMNFHIGEIPPEDRKTRWMGDIYAEAANRLEENPDCEKEVRQLFLRWDQREPEITALWEKTRKWSMDAFQEVYQLLDIHFDRIYFESEVEESGKEIVEQLIERKIAIDERPEGAVIVDLDALAGTEKMYRVLVMLRSDGTSLYPTKDIPLAIMKFKEYDLDRSIYVIDVRQSLYLKQIFKILELMGYQWADKCYHLAYEIVNLPGNVTIASREGTVVLLEDLIFEAESRALQIVREKNPDLDKNKQMGVARKVAIGALKYSLLSRDNTKIITFDWESAMDVNGHAAPCIQYAYVRANSILKKVNLSIPEDQELPYTLSEPEIELVDLLARFPQEVKRAANDLRPLLISSYSYELAKAFSDFYNQCPVLNSEENVRKFRLKIVSAFKQVAANSLALLGIGVPDVM